MLKRNASHLIWIISIMLISLEILIPSLTLAGSLEPDAAPAPTMKTLDEIEPRTAIPASSTAAEAYTISESGSYYLAGDRLCSATGINVTVDNVTIDLMGYSLIGSGTVSSYGIFMNGRINVEIKNGTVRGFQDGIYETNSTGVGHRVIDVRSMANYRCGIFIAASNSLVKDCTVSDNGNYSTLTIYGIRVGEGGTVNNNLLYNNGTSSTASSLYIISADDGSIVSNNVARGNGNASSGGGYLYVIFADYGSTVINNTVSNNGDSSGDYVCGIATNGGCNIVGNTSYYNGNNSSGVNVWGIYCGTGSTVANNTASYNGLGGTASNASGISLVGNNLVDGNTAFNNDGENFSTCPSCTLGTNHP